MSLTLKNLTKAYGKKIAVNGIDVEFKAGVNALLGVNGAGKTSLMKMLSTVMTPTKGKILYNNKNILKNEKEYRNKVGFLPQEFNGYPEFNAKDFLYYIGKLKDLSDKDIRKRTKELLELVSLYDVKGKKIKTFSGGMRRRLGIAQALLNNPEVVFLDEPTAGLDPKERIKFNNIINNLAKDKIIIVSTHIISDVENIASNFVVMKEGKVFLQGNAEEIIGTLEGKVWEYTLNSKEVADVEDIGNYRIDQNNNVIVRILSDNRPHEGAKQVKARIEDVFLNSAAEGMKNASFN